MALSYPAICSVIYLSPHIHTFGHFISENELLFEK